MATTRFANTSTAGTRRTALGNFERYLQDNNLSTTAVRALVQEPDGDKAFCRVMDRYALHLSLSKGSRGRVLSAGTVKLYYGAVKNCFFFIWILLYSTDERKLKSIASVVSKELKKKKPTPQSKHPCLKSDLATIVKIVKTIYETAGSEVDYWDAALVVVMWHVLRRSSDVVSLTRQSFCVHPGGASTLRFSRTSLQQGLALFSDRNMLTCSVHAIAVAVVFDIVPDWRLFRQLPAVAVDDNIVDEGIKMNYHSWILLWIISMILYQLQVVCENRLVFTRTLTDFSAVLMYQWCRCLN